jgi:hypothetical protein
MLVIQQPVRISNWEMFGVLEIEFWALFGIWYLVFGPAFRGIGAYLFFIVDRRKK